MPVPFKLSPSAAHRWMRCVGAAFLAPLAPWSPSIYAARGTLAQSVNERCLKEQLDPASFLGHVETVDGFEIKMNQDDIDAIAQCVDEINYLKNLKGAELFIEESFEIDMCGVTIRGRYDFALIADDWIFVNDYKHGVGKHVRAYKNPQLMLYLTALRDEFGSRNSVVAITQPRHRLGSTEWAPGENEYVDWLSESHNVIAKIVSASLESPTSIASNQGYWTPGEHCKWCPGELSCPAKARNLTAAALTSRTTPDASQTLWCMHHAGEIRDSLKSASDNVFAQLKSGQKVKGYKLIQTKPKAKMRTDYSRKEIDLLESVGIARTKTERQYCGVTDARKIAKNNSIDIEPYLCHGDPTVRIAPETDGRAEYIPSDEMFSLCRITKEV